MQVSVQECAEIEIAILCEFPMDTHCTTNALAFCFNYISQLPSLYFEYTGLLRILRTECILRVSESLFSFYTKHNSFLKESPKYCLSSGKTQSFYYAKVL